MKTRLEIIKKIRRTKSNSTGIKIPKNIIFPITNIYKGDKVLYVN